MKTKLVIWDWNGTILDDTRICFEIANAMLQARGLPAIPDLAAYRDLFCFPVINYYRAMGYTFEEESFEAVSEDFITRYLAAYPACGLRPHAVETAQALQRQGIRQAILSASMQSRLTEQVARFGLAGIYDPVLGIHNDLAHSKVDVAKTFLSGSGYAPEEVLLIGDTDHDLEAADSIGCPCVLLTGGHHNPGRLSALGVPVLEDVQDLIHYL